MPARIETVMLIDDESFDQKLYQRVIARSGIVGRVISHLYAEDALAYLMTADHDPVDVIFLDINMPRMNGFEFLDAATREIGASFAKIVVIMLTTSLEARDRERASRHPAVRRFINKPLTGSHLVEVAVLLEQIAATTRNTID
jgi:CheY-like chemotaxis protein